MAKPQKIYIKRPIILRKYPSKEFASPAKNIYSDSVIYRESEHKLLNDEYHNLTIVNSTNVLNNTTRTIATYLADDKNTEINSDEITKVIGDENYDVLLKALHSISDLKLKVQAFLALLTKNEGHQTVNKYSQTIETEMDNFIRSKNRKNRPKRCRAYVIDESQAKNMETKKAINDTSQKLERKDSVDTLVDIKYIVEEDSNISDGSISNLSILSNQIPIILENTKSVLKIIDKCTEQSLPTQSLTEERTILKLVDGGALTLPTKPADSFHIITSNTLSGLSVQDQKRMLLHQAYIDWKFCLQPDDEGNLPLHIAVINNDTVMLKRHCALLKELNESVDVLGGASMTPLQLSVSANNPACTTLLLESGADVLVRDEQARSVLHLAAAAKGGCVDAILNHCKQHARHILQDEELSNPELKAKSCEELASFLLQKMCAMSDDAGYTPLMIASMKGDCVTVTKLLKASPGSVNNQMPTSGDTALYLTFRTAFIEAEQSGDKTTIAPNYLRIIEILHNYGADPLIANNCGHSVATLTADCKISNLSQAVANRLLMPTTNTTKEFEKYMLVKDEEGEINVEQVTAKKRGPKKGTENKIKDNNGKKEHLKRNKSGAAELLCIEGDDEEFALNIHKRAKIYSTETQGTNVRINLEAADTHNKIKNETPKIKILEDIKLCGTNTHVIIKNPNLFKINVTDTINKGNTIITKIKNTTAVNLINRSGMPEVKYDTDNIRMVNENKNNIPSASTYEIKSIASSSKINTELKNKNEKNLIPTEYKISPGNFKPNTNETDANSSDGVSPPVATCSNIYAPGGKIKFVKIALVNNKPTIVAAHNKQTQEEEPK